MLPPKPSRSLEEIAQILEQYNGGPVVCEAGRDAVTHARRLHEIAKRYRSRLIKEFMERRGWDRETAERAADGQVLG